MTLQEAVERTTKCPVNYIRTVVVKETFRGQTVWEGGVNIDELREQPPQFAYGWTVADPEEHITVLGDGKIASPIAAVRAWIVSQAKR